MRPLGLRSRDATRSLALASVATVEVRRVRVALSIVSVFLLATSCAKEPPSPVGADASSSTADAQARRDGRVRLDDQWQAVVPLVIHEARMDLFVSCRLVSEQAKEAGREAPPLCYGEARRQVGAVRVIRVEHQPGTSVDAMKRLGMLAEGAHFVVERTGSRFQLLDLAYAARRDGLVREDEIRVLAMEGGAPRGAAEAVAPLVAELVALYPGVRVEALDVAPPAPPAPPVQADPAGEVAP